MTSETHFRRVTVEGDERPRIAVAQRLAERLEPGCTVLTVEFDHTDRETGHPVYLVRIDGPDPDER